MGVGIRPDKKTVPVLSYSVFAYEKGGTFRANGNGVQADSRGTDNKKG